MKIRDIEEKDIKPILGITSKCAYISMSEKNIHAYINNKIYKCLCCEDNNTISAFVIASIIKDEGEIIDIAVDANRRRERIASYLLSYFFDYSKTENVKRIMLDVNENNKDAIAFYEKKGFKSYGVRKKYYTKPRVSDAILMEIIL